MISYLYTVLRRIGYATLYILAIIIIGFFIISIALILGFVEMLKYLFIHGKETSNSLGL
jgi:hypothetical protein